MKKPTSIKRPALKDMTVEELREHAERIKALNPHFYEQTQSYRSALAQARRLGVEL